MINFIFANIKNIGYTLLAFFTLYLVKRNKNLSTDKKILIQENLQKDKVLDIQKKVIHATENVKSVDLADNLRRMQDGKL